MKLNYDDDFYDHPIRDSDLDDVLDEDDDPYHNYASPQVIQRK
jgi:hypothetical protein